MNAIQPKLLGLGACTFRKGYWALVLLALPLLSAAQGSVSVPAIDAAPATVARGSTASAGANTYIAAGTVRVGEPVKGNL